jgi:hypothetical protein
MDHKIEGSLEVLDGVVGMRDISSAIHLHRAKLMQKRYMGVTACKQLDSDLKKLAMANDALLKQIKKGATQSAPFGRLSYVQRRSQSEQKEQDQIVGSLSLVLAQGKKMVPLLKPSYGPSTI